jgi:hypothetical protein
MGTSQTMPSDHCPQCGAIMAPAQAACWLCRAESPLGPAAGTPIARAPRTEERPPSPTGRLQYDLSSLMLFMTLIAILSSIIGMNPGLGIVVAILAVPALVRTCVVASGGGARGQTLSPGGKVAVFLLTLAMIVTVIVATGAAFFFTCLATCALGASGGGHEGDSALMFAGIIFGLVASLVVGVLLTRLFWKLSHRKPPSANK